MGKKIYIYLLVVLLSAVLLTGCTKKTEEEESTDTTQQEQTGESEEEQEEQESEEVVNEDLGTLTNPDDFTNEKKSLGQSSDDEYTIASISDEQGDGYHEFLFEITTDTTDEVVTPLFVVEPVLEKGVLRITLSNIVGDLTSVTHEDGIDVDSGAITGLYRVVTSLEKTRIYDIGVLTNNPFDLELVEDEDRRWFFSVKVAYDTDYSPPTVDYGSTEFSSEMQEIEGMTSEDGAKILTYSYSMSGGIVKFIWSVASGASNPIPSVTAQYNESGVLDVVFTSLETDRVSGWGSSIALPGGVNVAVARAGEESTYSFSGISGMKEFKLSARQSPNQVIVEIKL
jgi:hypothetical protein